MAYALNEVCQNENSVAIAECDAKLLKVLKLMGIEAVILAEPIHYLGSETIPVMLTYNGLKNFFDKNCHLMSTQQVSALHQSVVLKQTGGVSTSGKDIIGEDNSIRPPKEMFSSGFLSQIGHILLFLLYRLPLWWIAAEFGNAEAGVLANALLMADTIWIFGNSFGTILHSRMLRWGARKSKFGKLLGLYVLVSGLGTLVAILMALLLPPSLYVWVFGSTFFGLKETFALISPAVLFLGLSAPIGHYLHAQNRFKELILSYGLSVLVLFLCWQGVDVFISHEAIGYHNSEPLQFMDRVMLNARQHFGKLMAVNMAFFVLLLSNYLQVRKDIQWQGISFVMRYFGQRRLAK